MRNWWALSHSVSLRAQEGDELLGSLSPSPGRPRTDGLTLRGQEGKEVIGSLRAQESEKLMGSLSVLRNVRD